MGEFVRDGTRGPMTCVILGPGKALFVTSELSHLIEGLPQR